MTNKNQTENVFRKQGFKIFDYDKDKDIWVGLHGCPPEICIEFNSANSSYYLRISVDVANKLKDTLCDAVECATQENAWRKP